MDRIIYMCRPILKALAKRDVRSFDDKITCSIDQHAKKYTSVTALNQSDIGQFCDSHNILHLVNSLCQLSVKVKVKMQSPDRKLKRNPDHYVEKLPTDNDFNNSPGTGSGTIQGIKDQGQNFCEIEILTANHVVFDNSEAILTECVLYFDDSQQRKPVSAVGVRMLKVNENDWCKLICKIVSKEIAEIKKNLATMKTLFIALKTLKALRRPKVIIISHPHGCQTYISMGDKKEDKDTCITYDTPTCIGSSGGYVMSIGCDDVYVHSGCKRDVKSGKVLFSFSSGKVDQPRQQTVNV